MTLLERVGIWERAVRTSEALTPSKTSKASFPAGSILDECCEIEIPFRNLFVIIEYVCRYYEVTLRESIN